ncbi:restriction system protein [Raineyella antarctica]|uniref:Restriction system protein n=1 Tax=Raineyella antarctica TaxID=1577474 RepID=A0A1G6IP78_9ACTN|nr:restriction endonuclease [Raineyella antarctica]SDC08297.1 restriction system protein [Raineyella antarctica]
MTNAWVVRAGSQGEHEQFNLENQVATISFQMVGDVTSCQRREDVRAIVDAAYPEDPGARRANTTGQVWAFRASIKPGDLVVMPSKLRPGYLYLGRCTGPFRYDAQETNASRRKQLPVEWKSDPVAKSAIKDDLLNSLNSIGTVFNPTRNNAAARLEQVWLTSEDPGNGSYGSSIASVNHPAASSPTSGDDGPGDVRDPETVPTLEAIRDRIRTHLVENFSGHKLTRLVADILEALGFSCEVSPAGPDGGVDILAGRGPLGLDSPTLIVEVKSEPGPVGAPVVRGLHSARTQHNSDQALLVAWGGVTNAARKEFERDRTFFRVWDAEEVLDRLFATYDRLPRDTQGKIPLKQAWVLDEETA